MSKQLVIGRSGTGKTTVLDVLALLRDVTVRGLPLEGCLGGKTRTRWQNVSEQRFELDVKGNGGDYRYTLVVDEYGHPPTPRVKQESLDFDSRPLFRFQMGKIGLFNDDQKPTPSVEVNCDWGSSGLVTVDAECKDNTKLAWFKQWLGGLTQVQINPWAMSVRSELDSNNLAKDMSNFADWYRHLLLDSGNVITEAKNRLFEDIPGLEAFDLQHAGQGVRVLQATLRSPNGGVVKLPFSDLSEGQRALITLYVVLYCAIGEDRTLLIDEPDNFITLAEIQPWLMKMLDRVDEQNAQVILVSHHPELLVQLADQGGVLFERPGGGETRVRRYEPLEDRGLRLSDIMAREWEAA